MTKIKANEQLFNNYRHLAARIRNLAATVQNDVEADILQELVDSYILVSEKIKDDLIRLQNDTIAYFRQSHIDDISPSQEEIDSLPLYESMHCSNCFHETSHKKVKDGYKCQECKIVKPFDVMGFV